MMTLLLVIIYISFISLGLPDSLLGSAWSVVQPELGVPVSFAGVVSMIVCAGTVVSSLMSTRLIARFKTGPVTAMSVALTAAALIGYSMADSGWFLCLLAIPMGLGAGSVDAALNNFVALHYKATHMNWLHCFWGIGASGGPLIMSFWLARNNNWHMGYLTIGIIQWILVAALIISLPLWKKAAARKRFVDKADMNGEMPEIALDGGKSAAAESAVQEIAEDRVESVPLRKVFRVPYAKPVMAAFFCYCALELTAGLWCGTYGVQKYSVSAHTAAAWTSVYYLGITLGRLASGFIAMKMSTDGLIRLGQIVAGIGALILLLPLPVFKVPVGMCLVGLGCAPIYPNMLHRTPKIFGENLSQALMGVQMAVAYIGSTLMPPLFGFIAEYAGIGLLPLYLLVFVAIMLVCSEAVAGKAK